MRQPIRVPQVLRYLLILGALCFAVRVHADDRSEARTHYQAGVKMYASGDYQGAIREFSAAQQLAPADLNNYNLALCYDKLGDADPAIQYYRAFLDKQPASDKRAEVEASVSRLEAASRSAAGKRADEARKADDARRAEEARKADEARRAPPPAGPVQGPPPGPAAGPAPGPTAGPPPAPAPEAGPVVGPEPSPAGPAETRRPGPVTQAPATGGSIGTPSTATPVPTGDSQLDRVNSINIDELRDQRTGSGAGMGGTAGRPVDHRAGAASPGGPAGPGGPAVAANDPMPPGQPSGGSALAPSDQPGGPDQPKKETPVYKKWWFWVIVPVVGYVAYNLVSSGSSSSTNRGRELPMGNASTQPGGLTLLHW